MKVPVAVCENEQCEKVIYKGENVWHKGQELYCSGKCLIESFGSPFKPFIQSVFKEKHVVGGVR